MDEVPTICESNDEELEYSNGSSDFLSSLDSIPSKRGFKMVFLNIISLPPLIDEIRFSLSNQFIDHIAFNEARLDSRITDGMIHLNDYDLIRKGRSRNGVESVSTCAAQLITK